MTRLFVSRLLLGLSAFLLFAGGTVHALAFPTAALVMEAAAMPAFFIAAYKALWVVNSSNHAVLGGFYSYVALRTGAPKAAPVAILALGPLASALLIYFHMGGFFAGHLMLLSGVLALMAAALAAWRSNPRASVSS